MTVKNLKKLLEGIDENLEVMIPDETGEFDFTELETVRVKKIIFSEENGVKSEPYAERKCLVLKNE